MKVTSDDITPDLLRVVLRDMMQESPSLTQKELCRRLSDVSLDNEDINERLQQLIDYVVSYIPSCYPPDNCACQIKAIAITSICVGLMIGNACDDNVELRWMVK